uniref:Protein kinase domain-containing protein n=1 Tax=Piliocolobus tephrosceles TaxID=591936 RepID=A0A8C9HLR5_9PRIM
MEKNTNERYIFKPNFLGEGSYGKVYKAYDTVLKKEVAIKKMRINKISNCIDECGINFVLLREIKIMKEIKHKNIMT